MAAHLGDLFRCSDPDCGFEVLVVHDTVHPQRASGCPVCCCGRPMSVVTG